MHAMVMHPLLFSFVLCNLLRSFIVCLHAYAAGHSMFCLGIVRTVQNQLLLKLTVQTSKSSMLISIPIRRQVTSEFLK